jgi:hypothetical protein
VWAVRTTSHKTSAEKLEGKKAIRCTCGLKDNIKLDLKQVGTTELALDRAKWRALVSKVMNTWNSIKGKVIC